MIEMVKSKGMLCFILFMMGICYFSANSINNQATMKEDLNNNLIVLNEK